jgi:tRNA(Leu) C34 or U34 (ribose-2'-O)-methylase TrmL
LEIPMVGRSFDLLQAAAMVVGDWWRDRTQP